MAKNNVINTLFLLLIPIAYLVSYGWLGLLKGPYYWTPNQDPDYTYLLDSLNLINSNPLAIIQHPGTLVQIVGAIVLGITYTIQSISTATNSITDAVLTNPELYLSSINYTLLGITATCLFLIGFINIGFSRNLFLSIVLQTTPLMMAMSILVSGSRVSPESLLFAISQILAILLIIYFYKPGVERSLQFAVSFGVVLGIGTATKLTFLPMIVLIGLLPGIKRKSIAIASAIVLFLIVILPAINQPGGLVNLLTRTGFNNSGQSPANNLTTIENLSALISDHIILLALTVLLTIGCLIIPVIFYTKNNSSSDQNNSHHKRLLWLACLVAIALWLQLVLAVSTQVQVRHLMPAIGLAGVTAFLIVRLYLIGLLAIIKDALDTATLTEFVMAIALAFCVALSIHQVYSSLQVVKPRYDLRNAEFQTLQTLLSDQQYQSCTVALSRRASTVKSALKFADFWTGNRFGASLDRLYPQTIFYLEDSQTYESYNEPLNAIAPLQQEQSCILFHTNPLRGRRAQFTNSNLEPIFRGRTEELYRIKTSA